MSVHYLNLSGKFKNTTQRENYSRVGHDNEVANLPDDFTDYLGNFIYTNCEIFFWKCRQSFRFKLEVSQINRNIWVMLYHLLVQ